MEELFEDMTYYVVVDMDEETFNVFDEDNYVHIPDSDWIVCKISGEENLEQVLKLLWKLLPTYTQVQPQI